MLDIKADINKYKTETEMGVKYHMCKAWDDHMERGRKEGRQKYLIECICKKLRKGKTIGLIAEDLEEEVSVIEKIYEIAKNFAPEYNVDEILKIEQLDRIIV